MKTRKEWDKQGGSFTDYANPGDMIDEAIYDYFIGVVYPARMSPFGFLMGECISHDKDGWALYECFIRVGEQFKYVGPTTIDDFDNGRL